MLVTSEVARSDNCQFISAGDHGYMCPPDPVSHWVPYIYHCQDVHPESLRITGHIGGGWSYRYAISMDRKNRRQSLRCVTLSADMAGTIRDSAMNAVQLLVINNPAITAFDETRDIELPVEFPRRSFVVLFAGNHGAFQGLDNLVEVATDATFLFGSDFCIYGRGSQESRTDQTCWKEIGKHAVLSTPTESRGGSDGDEEV